MALRITIEGAAGSGKSAVATLIEELLVTHGFMVGANINTPRPKGGAAAVARTISMNDPRVILIEAHDPPPEAKRSK